MSPIQSISEKVHLLPESVQQQVLDYIEFLIAKYDSSSEISDEMKELLDSRLEKAEANPEANMSWKEARKSIHEKMSWE